MEFNLFVSSNRILYIVSDRQMYLLFSSSIFVCVLNWKKGSVGVTITHYSPENMDFRNSFTIRKYLCVHVSLSKSWLAVLESFELLLEKGNNFTQIFSEILWSISLHAELSRMKVFVTFTFP